MPRPSQPPGTYGNISITAQPDTRRGKPRYKARARFRTADGRTVFVAKFGQTKRAARDALKTALSDFKAAARSDEIGARTTIAELADMWLGTEHDWAWNTAETYSLVVKNQVKPVLGAVRVCETRPSLVNSALTRIRAEHGPGAAKTAKSVLSGMFGLAVANDAILFNPIRDAIAISRVTRKSAVRSLTVAETDDLCDKLRCDPLAVHYDLPDLVEFMLGTGARIGETCAAWAASLDLDAGTWEIDGTAVRHKGVGMVRQPRTKTEAGWRVLALPSGLVEMAARRRTEMRWRTDDGIVFGSPHAGTLRDPSNTSGDLRDALDRAGFDWVKSHTFRKTVATRLDDAGLSARAIADQLGHAKPSMTQDVYMGRNVVSAAAARILDR